MDIDAKALAAFCERNGIIRLRVFGSFARGDAAEGSDVDLIVDFMGSTSLLELVRIEREFAEQLGRPVDLFTERALSPYLRDRILSEARVVYERAA